MAEGVWKIAEFKGLDQSLHEQSIAEGASPDLQNVRCEGGCLETVRGCVKYTPEGVPGGIHSLAVFYSRVKPVLLAINEEGVYSLGGEGWELRYAQEGLGRASFLNYAKDGQDVILLATGGQTLWWNGEDEMEPLPGAPEGLRHLALHYERVWGAGRTDEPDTVYWSRPYDPNDWTPHAQMPEAGGGFVLMPTWNGGRVRGLKNYFGDVVVFKDSDIFRIYGTYPGNYEVVRVHGVSGPVAERTVVPWGDRVFFFSRDGLCAYNGVTARPVDKERVRVFFDGIDYDRAQDTACAAVHKDRLYLALPEKGAEGNSAILEIDLLRDIWTLRRGVRVNDFLAWDGKLLFCNDTGYVYALDEGETYDGAPIDAYWTSKPMDFGRKGMRKRGGKLRVNGSGEAVFRQRDERGERAQAVRLARGRPAAARLRGVGYSMRLRVENRSGRPFCIEGGIEWDVEADEE